MVREAAGGAGRVAVIDIGSNSLRLVVYDGLSRAPLALFNEKVLCGLGRGLTQTGRLNEEARPVALASLERFAALSRAIGVERLEVVATAAVRDAADGPDFVAEVERRGGVTVRILPGEDEGRLSALGVIAGIPDAAGIMGDLGGGSVELVPVGDGVPGPSTTLPIGPLRIAELADNPKKLREALDAQIASVPQLEAGRGRNFYLVGGAWRAIARIHMEQTGYPLHIIQGYTLARFEAESFLDILSRMSRKSLDKITNVSKKRLEVVPLAALLLERLVRRIEPRRLVFSAYGLREGLLFDRLSADERQRDPLIVACEKAAAAHRRFDMDGLELAEWALPAPGEAGERRFRLVLAVALLSDTAWREHPDYRAEQACLGALRMPFAGLDHAERVFIATALHARYGGPADAPVLQPTRRLLRDEDAALARTSGLALRLAYTMTGGAPHLLELTRLTVEDGAVVLALPPNRPELGGEAVQRRLDALGRALGLKPRMTTLAPPPRPRDRAASRA